MAQTFIVIIFMNVVFQTPCNGPIWLLIVMSLLQGFGGMCYGKNPTNPSFHIFKEPSLLNHSVISEPFLAQNKPA